MSRASILLGLALGSVVVAVACSGSNATTSSATDAGSATDASATSDAATASSAQAPPTGTGIALVDRLGAAAAACGKQSMFTVPGGWENVAIGEQGCMVWVPGGWKIEGAFTSIATAFSDGTGVEGFVGVAGATRELTTCAPAPARASLLAGFDAKGYEGTKSIWTYEGTEPFGGTNWSTGHAVFTSTKSSTPIVGYLWVLTTPTAIACDVVGLGIWEPQDRIDADTCTLTQILSSVKCPSGGGCDAAECDRSCKDEGHAGGSCNSGCACY